MNKPRKFKLNIFSVLNNISKKNFGFYDSLSTDEKKGFVARVVYQWLSGTSDKNQILYINELNYLIDPLYKHPGLLYKLFCIFTRPNNHRFTWISANKKQIRAPESVKLIQYVYGYNTQESVETLELYTKEEILELARQHGYQDAEIAKIKKEL